MMTTSPRLRIDLQATPVEDADGVLYYDVSDPKTGSVLRLFDFEWLLAQRLDGAHSIDALVGFAEEHLGFTTSRADLEVYAEKLHEFGLVELAAVSAPQAAPPAVSQPEPLPATPTTPPLPVAEMPARAMERSAPELSRPAPEPSRPTATSGDDDGLMGRPVISLPKAPSTPLAKSGPVVEPKPARPADTGPSAPSRVAAKANSGPSGPSRAALQEALAGLPAPDDESPTSDLAGTSPLAPSTPAVLNTAPTALIEQVSPPSEAKTGPLPQVDELPDDLKPTPSVGVDIPVVIQPVKKPQVEPPVAAPVQSPVLAPVQPPMVAPPPVGPVPSITVSPPVPEIKAPPPVAIEPTAEPAGGGAGKWIALVVLLLIAAVAYYFMVYKPKQEPPPINVQLSVAKIEDVPRLYPSPAEVKKAVPQTFKLESDGTVAKVAAENDEVAAEAPLVVLDTDAQYEKELTELHTRIEQLQKKLESAKGKLKQDTQTKLDEKLARVSVVENLQKKSKVLAVRPGTVSKVLVKVGDAVTAGTEAASVTDKALTVEVKVPALEAQGLKAGSEAKLSSGAAPNGGTIAAQIIGIKTEGEFASLALSLPLDTAAKPGDKLSLQHGMLEKVVRLPAAAVMDGNKVYLNSAGKATVRQVVVADRDGDSVLVQGLADGDAVILSRPPELHEGTAVSGSASSAAASPAH